MPHFIHRIVLIERDGKERIVGEFKTQLSFAFGRAAMRRFRAAAKAFDAISPSPILTPTRFVKDGTVAGGHWTLYDGRVLELR